MALPAILAKAGPFLLKAAKDPRVQQAALQLAPQILDLMKKKDPKKAAVTESKITAAGDNKQALLGIVDTLLGFLSQFVEEKMTTANSISSCKHSVYVGSRILSNEKQLEGILTELMEVV